MKISALFKICIINSENIIKYLIRDVSFEFFTTNFRSFALIIHSSMRNYKYTSTWPISYLENVKTMYPFPFTAHHTDTILFYRCFTYYCNSSLLPLYDSPFPFQSYLFSRTHYYPEYIISQLLRLITRTISNSLHRTEVS